MTDTELIERVEGIIDPSAKCLHRLRRGGRWLLALPHEREAFSLALNLYQPQRPAARMVVRAVDLLSRTGCRGLAMARVDLKPVAQPLTPPLPAVDPGTCGILLGSPEHRVRRAIASYRNAGNWEVAKISFGPEGAGILEQEARTLEELAPLVKGVPRLLGLHRSDDATVLRMPYLTGKAIHPGDFAAAIDLLSSWITNESPRPIPSFAEFPAIHAALSGSRAGSMVLERLSRLQLVPVIRHGDFARWNLRRQADGSLVVLDWEWGHASGMPGIDLVHYFLQDARLVRKKPPTQAINETIHALKAPTCADYLERTGWGDDPLLPIIACLAWKQGAGHQENAEILDVMLNFEF
jgi:hypothetical protein